MNKILRLAKLILMLADFVKQLTDKIMATKKSIQGEATQGKSIQGDATRGIRNNNPLNIRHSKNQWQGMKVQQNDKAFVQFKSRKYGYRAAFVLIRTYIEKHHANTIGKIIARWAPSQDGNNTLGYINYVSNTTGIAADEPLRFGNQKQMVGIVRSMAQMESGIIENEDILNEAYCMAL